MVTDVTSQSSPERCVYCGAADHDQPERCPLVSAVEYHPDGRIARIEKSSGYSHQTYLPAPNVPWWWGDPFVITATSSTGTWTTAA